MPHTTLISTEALAAHAGPDWVIVDCRYDLGNEQWGRDEYLSGHVPGAVNLPEEKWDTLEGLSKEATNVLYCYTQTCHLASRAAQRFSREGYPVMEMEGGFEAWKDSDLEIQK